MKTPRLRAFLAAAVLIAAAGNQAWSHDPVKPPIVTDPEAPLRPPHPRKLNFVGPPVSESDSVPPTASKAMQAALAKIGWEAINNGALVRLEGPDKGYIPGNYLDAAELEWRNGRLNFTGGDAIDAQLLPRVLDGLWIFVSAARMPASEAGKQLAAWGLPPVIDGRKLVDPDGTATYYGQMLRLMYAEKPDALPRASVERLSQALDLLLHAHQQAFDHQAPDVAKTDVDRAKLMLFAPPRAGETPFAVKPYEDLASLLGGVVKQLEGDRDAAAAAGDFVREKDSASALTVLASLQRQRYHAKIDLPEVPPPGRPAPEKPDDDDSMRAPGAPLASGLPLVLRALDRINGKPLTPDQQENLIKSFPMGDLVWRLGAQKLWSQGLTGQDVKVAVIDGGIGRHDELAAAVRSRTNLTAERGKALTDDHGTHVAGIIHAIAPDAQINGYTVFPGDAGNPALKEGSDGPVLNAIAKAVKDGNRIISMSLGGDGSPSDIVARKIQEYEGKGVIFIIAAGNEHAENGVEAPAVAPNAFAVGALDAAGRAADFSSYGANFDPRGPQGPHAVVKRVYMTPGTNIYSTVMDEDGRSDYELMDGTSMATPALSGVTALLVHSAAAMNPVAFSACLSDALAESSKPLSLDKVPANAPFDQQFLVVDPSAALDALRRLSAPLTAGQPAAPAAR